MRNQFIAVDAATDLRSLARTLRRSWESAMGGSACADVRPVIDRSWQRLTCAGLDPEHLHPQTALDGSELDELRAASPLNNVIDLLRGCLLRFTDDSEHVMVVVDELGRVLWVEGHPRVRQRADRIQFREGMYWTEESSGTNAIGTALAIDHAVQIFSAEHFLAEQHPWWCSAAPIHDPLTGRSLGVVDLSGPLRTAHPYSLALVTAAAGFAEEALARRQAEADERLRRAFLEYQPRGAGGRRAVIAPDGRVLLAKPGGWINGRVGPPSAGHCELPSGGLVDAEPLTDGGWIIYERTRPTARSRTCPLRLRLLGHGPYVAQVGDGPPVSLSSRHAEILADLAMYRDGLNCNELTLHLYGEDGNPVSTRAELSRLRRLIAPTLAARPYRIVGDVSADFLEVEERLSLGDVAAALDLYRGPLLPRSDAPRIEQARDELEAAVVRAVRASPASLWAWLQTERGRADADSMAAFIRAVPPTDPRRPVVAARLRSLQLRAGSWVAPAAAPLPQ